MLYLAVVALLVLTFGAIALVAGLRQAKDGYEDETGFHGEHGHASARDHALDPLGRSVVPLPPQRR